ncbi:hypothetical protein BKA62DRAFT_687857 [Auriculariales sp. MPI-PUGE-AT-0066]|nr:hypothetical protein BKA62DRAFT_687857 [Auriculariales sp. MPI-PUGE-AT-0066]
MGQLTERAPKSKQAGKSKTKLATAAKGPKWPQLIPVPPAVTATMIGCDVCDCWYHFTCVGIPLDEDFDSDPDRTFECPLCAAERAQGVRNPQRHGIELCTRPGCPHVSTGDEFYIERLVGRRPSGTPGVPLYMVRWEGFGIRDCTWQPAHTLPRPEKLIADFEAAATLEKQNVLNADSIILLEEVLLDPDI